MLTVCRSVVLGAAFLAGVAIAATADPLCHTPTGPRRPPGPQIAASHSADAASAPDSVTLPEVNVFGPQPPGQRYCVCLRTEAEPHP
jgi:hypothetical protein